jgi:hypothetical protein
MVTTLFLVLVIINGGNDLATQLAGSLTLDTTTEQLATMVIPTVKDAEVCSAYTEVVNNASNRHMVFMPDIHADSVPTHAINHK